MERELVLERELGVLNVFNGILRIGIMNKRQILRLFKLSDDFSVNFTLNNLLGLLIQNVISNLSNYKLHRKIYLESYNSEDFSHYTLALDDSLFSLLDTHSLSQHFSHLNINTTDTIDTVDTMDTVDTVDTGDTGDTVENTENTENTIDTWEVKFGECLGVDEMYENLMSGRLCDGSEADFEKFKTAILTNKYDFISPKFINQIVNLL
uniref:Uncharacterized protein n=2 Tax=Theileria parva TaxID=5875 RepID=Q4N3A5_THEPA|eukprot:XP_763717.1 hypothetical protein [Theileria parva strain Muguga]